MNIVKIMVKMFVFMIYFRLSDMDKVFFVVLFSVVVVILMI